MVPSVLVSPAWVATPTSARRVEQIHKQNRAIGVEPLCGSDINWPSTGAIEGGADTTP